MILKLPNRIVRLLNDDYRRSEGIELAQQWINSQSGKIDVRNADLNRNNRELYEIRDYVAKFIE